MTMNRVRFALFGIFISFLAVQAVALVAASQRMWPEDLRALMTKLLGIYSIHLGIIAGGIFAHGRGRLPNPPAARAWAALVLAIFWNVLFAWRTLAFVIADQDSAADLIGYLDSMADASSFLVATALAFFFAKGAERDRSRAG